jgi:hypothetical protein
VHWVAGGESGESGVQKTPHGGVGGSGEAVPPCCAGRRVGRATTRVCWPSPLTCTGWGSGAAQRRARDVHSAGLPAWQVQPPPSAPQAAETPTPHRGPSPSLPPQTSDAQLAHKGLRRQLAPSRLTIVSSMVSRTGPCSDRCADRYMKEGTAATAAAARSEAARWGGVIMMRRGEDRGERPAWWLQVWCSCIL